MFKKFHVALFGALVLGLTSFSAAWDSEGTIDHMFVSDAGPSPAYSSSTPTCLVHLTDNKYFIFAVNTDIGKGMLAEVLTARANGFTLWVAYSGTIGGYNKAQVIYILP